MGLAIDREQFDPVDYRRFEERLDECLLAMGRLLERPGFGTGPTTLGAELELFLVDSQGRALPLNQVVRAEAADPRVVLEIDRFNLELNLTPAPLQGRPFAAFASELDQALSIVRRAAAWHGGRIVMVGILPTLRVEDLELAAISDAVRYRALNNGIRLKGAQTRSCSLSVLMEEAAEQIASVYSALVILAKDGQLGRRVWRLQQQRPVGTVAVVVLDVDSKDLLEVAASDDQQPVQTLGPDRPHPALGVRVRPGRPQRRAEHLATVRAENLVETAAELGVPVVDKEAHLPAPLAQHQQEVAGLLGDPPAVRVSRNPGQVHSPTVQFDEEQHVQPPQPHRLHGEEVTGHDPGGLLAQERRPGGGHPPWRRVEPVAAQRHADRGGRDPNAEVQQLALDALVAPAGILRGESDDQPLHVIVDSRPAGVVLRVGPGAGDEAPVPAQQRLGLDEEAGPHRPRQHTADRGQQRPVSRLEPGS